MRSSRLYLLQRSGRPRGLRRQFSTLGGVRCPSTLAKTACALAGSLRHYLIRIHHPACRDAPGQRCDPEVRQQGLCGRRVVARYTWAPPRRQGPGQGPGGHQRSALLRLSGALPGADAASRSERGRSPSHHLHLPRSHAASASGFHSAALRSISLPPRTSNSVARS